MGWIKSKSWCLPAPAPSSPDLPALQSPPLPTMHIFSYFIFDTLASTVHPVLSSPASGPLHRLYSLSMTPPSQLFVWIMSTHSLSLHGSIPSSTMPSQAPLMRPTLPSMYPQHPQLFSHNPLPQFVIAHLIRIIVHILRKLGPTAWAQPGLTRIYLAPAMWPWPRHQVSALQFLHL